MRINVEADADFFFECGFEFSFKSVDKLTHPPVAFVVLLAVADEDLPAGRQVS